MSDPVYTEVRLLSQGGPIVDGEALVVHRYDKLVAISVGFTSKNCHIAFSGTENDAPRFGVWKGFKLKEGLENEITEFSLPEFVGWSLFAWRFGRYSMEICLAMEW